MSFKKVCLVGANGTLGSVILDGLVAAGDFDVYILKRKSSASTPAHADALTKIPIADNLPLDDLTEALRNQDVVIAAFPLKDVSQHLRLVEAALRAGVKRVLPADFGSCDAASPQAQRLLKLYRDKDMVREKCEKLAAGNEGFTWTALVCGHFFDYGLRDGLLHFDLKAHTAQILDSGDIKASASTLRRVAEGVVAVLRRPEETSNKTLYIQSFCPTQLEILAALERATGHKWKTQSLDSNAFLEKEKKKLDEGDHEAVEEIVFVLGTVDADWTTRHNFAMDLLGLKDESLDDVVAEVLAGEAKA